MIRPRRFARLAVAALAPCALLLASPGPAIAQPARPDRPAQAQPQTEPRREPQAQPAQRPAPPQGQAQGQPQEPSAQPQALPPGHPPIAGGGAAGGAPEDPHAGIPMGGDPHAGITGGGDPHAGIGAGPGDQVPGFSRRDLPEEGAAESPDLPPGVVLVRVVDARGEPVPDVLVRLGVLRDGESQPGAEARTAASGPNVGVAQFEHLAVSPTTAYRAKVENDGARFSSTPFILGPRAGTRVQLIRYEVEHQPRALLISDARVEIGFSDDRLVVVERISVVNFSAISLGGDEPRPYAYVPPPEGLRFRLPAGYTAFRTDEQQTMGDQSLGEEDGNAVFRGSIPPTANPREPLQLVFQYHIKIRATDVDFSLALPLPALRAMIVTQAPAGMRLTVDGMEPGQERTHNNQRILVTGRERTSREDPPLDHIVVHMAGIPPIAGPERLFALLLAMGLVAGSIVFAVGRARQAAGRKGRTRSAIAQLEAERDRILADAAELARARESGEVGPETFDRRRRELTLALAAVLKDLAESTSPPPRGGTRTQERVAAAG